MLEQARDIIVKLVRINLEKAGKLDELLELTRLQSVDLSSNSLNSLLDHIHQKQDVMNSIDELDRKFYNNFVELKTIIGVSSIQDISAEDYPEIIQLKESVAKVMGKLTDIERLDKANIKTVNEEMDKVKGDMKTLSSQTRARKGYASAYTSDSPGFFIDGKK